MRTLPLLLAAAMVAAPMLAHATACEMTTSRPEFDSGTTPAGRWYVDNDVIQTDGPLFSIWVYEESNGIDGLQRGDEIVDDTCGGAAGRSDTILL